MFYTLLARMVVGVILAVTLFATSAAAQTYKITAKITGTGGETGTIVLTMAGSPTDDILFAETDSLHPQAQNAQITINNIPTSQTSTTFTLTDIRGMAIERLGGTYRDLNIWTNTNSDGFSLSGENFFTMSITGHPYSSMLTIFEVETDTSVAAPVPTLSEWSMMLLALALAGGSGFIITRNRRKLA